MELMIILDITTLLSQAEGTNLHACSFYINILSYVHVQKHQIQNKTHNVTTHSYKMNKQGNYIASYNIELTVNYN